MADPETLFSFGLEPIAIELRDSFPDCCISEKKVVLLGCRLRNHPITTQQYFWESLAERGGAKNL